MSTYDFPQDLRDAQLALHETRAAYEQYATTLPWSAAPMPGWEADKQLHSTYRSGKPDSPGYSAEQAAEVARYQAELLRLSTVVSTHPYWSTLDSGVVTARMALKHAHETGDEAA
ncbi:hypothetical protein OHA79_51970 (plasmid) [Streptomyces sp. NBC_00841]|uniref:hypothetical protein n=1 Tax=Streptomyces sp. NBC_00841 TaxID=2975847 RepID=UPI002DDB5E0B|nr:hypothetical protein [Streptomyces sp. NBC_00841]WSA06001.1 hypothetical protein OHA79_51970 [Streptomyces sp. NBC_00841]